MLNGLYAALLILGLPVILIAIGLMERPDGFVWIYRTVRDEKGRPRALLITGLLVILVFVLFLVIYR
jgi:hypothetical protein